MNLEQISLTLEALWQDLLLLLDARFRKGDLTFFSIAFEDLDLLKLLFVLAIFHHGLIEVFVLNFHLVENHLEYNARSELLIVFSLSTQLLVLLGNSTLL